MAGLLKGNLDRPDESRPFKDAKGRLDLVNIEGTPIGVATFEPGWQWSKHVQPIAGTDSCEADHFGYFLSGHMVVKMDDGQEMEFGPGDVMKCAPGHDAWIVGNETRRIVDWAGYADYAKG